MPLALRAPPRSSSLTLRSSLRLILPLEGLPGDVANDFPAALHFLDWHLLFPPLYDSVPSLPIGRYSLDFATCEPCSSIFSFTESYGCLFRAASTKP